MYPERDEFIITDEIARLMQRQLAMMSIEHVRRITEALEQLSAHGYGSVTIRYREGRPWLIDITVTNNLKDN